MWNEYWKYRGLFFWPLDFTFVCPTEILAHNRRMEAFKQRGVEVVGVSIDSQFTHFAWRNTPVKEGGIGPIQFPMVADVKHDIIRAFGIEHPDAGVALRASFLIDRDGTVQHQVVNNLPLGRNVDEMLRMVDALQFTEAHGEVCPAGWNKGDEGMRPTTDGVADYLAGNAEKL
jgi:peroxiredoxin (alkyl hydroperoxide reductase subunit C)